LTPQARRAVRVGLHLGLAHHPLCTEFRTDLVRFGRLHVCSGCLATWPVFVLAFPLGLLARLEGAPALALAAAGLALGLPQMATYRWRMSRLERAAAKAVGGVGLAMVLAGILTAGWPTVAVVAVLTAGVLASLGLQVIRLRSILATCDACPFRRDWDACPGFQPPAAPPEGPAVGPASLLVR
jgi:hypothetical protein